MNIKILASLLFAASLSAQVTITPSSVQITTTGQVVQFSSNATKPAWNLSGAGSINGTGQYTAPATMPTNAFYSQVVVSVFDVGQPGFPSAHSVFFLPVTTIPTLVGLQATMSDGSRANVLPGNGLMVTPGPNGAWVLSSVPSYSVLVTGTLKLIYSGDAWSAQITGWESFHSGPAYDPEGTAVIFRNGLKMSMGTDYQIRYVSDRNTAQTGTLRVMPCVLAVNTACVPTPTAWGANDGVEAVYTIIK